jgi:hypothetical protein
VPSKSSEEGASRMLFDVSRTTPLTITLVYHSRFGIDIERLCASEEPKKKKKVYADLDAKLKRIGCLIVSIIWKNI